jgi:hypothetical protein
MNNTFGREVSAGSCVAATAKRRTKAINLIEGLLPL